MIISISSVDDHSRAIPVKCSHPWLEKSKRICYYIIGWHETFISAYTVLVERLDFSSFRQSRSVEIVLLGIQSLCTGDRYRE